MYQPNVIWSGPVSENRHRTHANGLRYVRRHQVRMLRRRYRELRDLGMPADRARYLLWSTANDATHDTEFVSYKEVAG